MLTKHTQSGQLAQSCREVQQLQDLMQASLKGVSTQHTQNITAVLYCFAVAAPAQMQPLLSSRSASVNKLIPSLALLLSSRDVSIDSAQVWQDWQLLLRSVGLDDCHMCALLTPASKTTFLRLQIAATSPNLSTKLQVDRTSVLEDAHSGLRATNMLSTSGPCVVSPRFITHFPAYVNELAENHLHSNHVGFTEEGEGFGPRKEFFLLAGQAMTDQLAGSKQQPPLFVYNHSAACYWYNTSLQEQSTAVELYRVAGWLAGQSIHNRACLGIKLAPVLWQKVLEGDSFQASLPVLQDFDPQAAQALNQLSSTSPAVFQALLEMDALPQDMTAEGYTSQAVQRVLVDQVQWQSKAFAQGFTAAFSLAALQAHLVSANDLSAMVCGSCTAWAQANQLQDIFHVICDKQLQQEYKLLADVFWEAHTCGNILELPNYEESVLAVHKTQTGELPEKQLRQMLAQVLDDRLRVALTCSTYGLDEK